MSRASRSFWVCNCQRQQQSRLRELASLKQLSGSTVVVSACERFWKSMLECLAHSCKHSFQEHHSAEVRMPLSLRASLALVVQWIEQPRPKGLMSVRFRPRAHKRFRRFRLRITAPKSYSRSEAISSRRRAASALKWYTLCVVASIMPVSSCARMRCET